MVATALDGRRRWQEQCERSMMIRDRGEGVRRGMMGVERDENSNNP